MARRSDKHAGLRILAVYFSVLFLATTNYEYCKGCCLLRHESQNGKGSWASTGKEKLNENNCQRKSKNAKTGRDPAVGNNKMVELTRRNGSNEGKRMESEYSTLAECAAGPWWRCAAKTKVACWPLVPVMLNAQWLARPFLFINLSFRTFPIVQQLPFPFIILSYSFSSFTAPGFFFSARTPALVIAGRRRQQTFLLVSHWKNIKQRGGRQGDGR